jgi:haloacetate dehalogenase
MTFEEFESIEVQTDETRISLRRCGEGPPVLLLHGFPQTHLMWRSVAPLLARQFTVICPDLRGYGRSFCPASRPDHAPYSKRAMAKDMVAVMAELGFERFSVAGHDRGGRVAYRLALDHPERVGRLAVLDIVPTGDVWERADRKFARAFWPWSLLAQPEPLPERLLSAAPQAVIDDALGGWGSPATAFSAEVHDEADRQAGRRIAAPVLVLWGGWGGLDSWYKEEGGPIGLWRAWADDVRGMALDAGHFFPEEIPERTADELTRFFELQ